MHEQHQSPEVEPSRARGWIRVTGSDEWSPAAVALERDGIGIVLPERRDTPGPVIRFRRIDHATVVGLDEVAPFGRDPLAVELRTDVGEVLWLHLPRSFVDSWCGMLASGGEAGAEGAARPTNAARRRGRVRIAAAMLAASLGLLVWSSVAEAPDSVASDPTTTTVAARSWPPVPVPPTVTPERPPEVPTTSEEVAAPAGPASGTGAAEGDAPRGPPDPPAAPPEFDAIAPLTGLPAKAADLQRPAIVSKIDAARAAMPQVGMELADVVYEVKVEGMSRYLAVWHSREPAVVGPHRSARTSDPDLLSMFGHPLFAFSGANPGVVQTLAETHWKTGVGPGEVGHAYFRDESRPWPHNLFAATEHLRSRPSPPVYPSPIVEFHRADRPVGGLPAGSFRVRVGTDVEFRWDPHLGGWRRRVWDTDHLHATGAPVAPTNVVVVGTGYGVSHADANSPEAISVGTGPAWVFSRGEVRAGTWSRAHRFEPWNLRRSDGSALTLDPGTSWVVLADGDPVVQP